MSGIVWAVVGLIVGLTLDRLQHNFLAKRTKAQELAGVLSAIYDRWLKAGSVVRAWRDEDVQVAISQAEGQALDQASVFCARFGHLQETTEVKP